MTFQKIYDCIVAIAPQLAPKNTYVIYEWLASGYDPEKDIIPAVRFATKHGVRNIRAFGYFTGAIQSQHSRRLKEQHKPVQISQQERDTIRAKNIRWHKDRGITSIALGPQDYTWLEQYEKEHGQIAP